MYIPDSNLKFLLHGDALTDSSSTPKTITNSGVQISSTQAKFGSKSLYYTGTSSFSIPNQINGGMDFTVEYWVYHTGGSQFWSHGGSNNSGGGVFCNSGTSVTWYATGNLINASHSNSGKWYHCAWVKQSGTTKVYVNGALIGSSGTNRSFSNSAERFGWNDSSSSEHFNGYIQEIRISDKALYTGNFVAPTTPTYKIICNSSNTSMGTASGTGWYDSSVTVTATPANDNYLFKNWTLNGTVVSTNYSYTFTPTANVTLVANFKKRPVIRGYIIAK